MSREELTDKILNSYRTYYDIERFEGVTSGLIARCSFFMRSEKYVLVKKAKLWSADSTEYVYVFSFPKLTKELYEQCRDDAYEKGMALIDPKPGHMCTYITTLFICDEADSDAVKSLKRCRLHKNFQFSLLGWMDFHTALVTENDSRIYTNGSGRDNAKFLKRICMYKNKKGGSV